MAHDEQRVFFQSVKNSMPKYFNNQKVLEVGSLDINGTCRDFFDSCDYIGCDVGPGPGVDVIEEGQNLTFPSGFFGVTVSAECFEHNPYWKETFENMIRMTQPGGLVMFTCASEGRPEHGTSRTTPGDSPLTVDKGWDYYRNLVESDFVDNVDLSIFSTYSFSVNNNTHDLYFVGTK